MKLRILICTTVTLFAFTACINTGDFSTRAGECYRGKIVKNENLRLGFADDVTMTLDSLDVSALVNGNYETSFFTTSDGRFSKTHFAQMSNLAYDSISLFQFPGGRISNYLTQTKEIDNAATLVVSLMENEEVEVRIIRNSGDDPLFGVFKLLLKENCN